MYLHKQEYIKEKMCTNNNYNFTFIANSS